MNAGGATAGNASARRTCNTLVPESLARALGIVPLAYGDGLLQLGCRSDRHLVVQDRLAHSLPRGITITFQALDDNDLQQALDRCYGVAESLTALLARYPTSPESDADAAPPATELLELLLRDAVWQRASDLHLRQRDGVVVVRLRIDGRVRTVHELPGVCAPSLMVRIKVAAGLDIAESRRPQDGQGECLVYGQPVYFRVASMPTRYGESVVLRLFDPAAVSLTLTDLQPCTHMLRQLQTLARPVDGLVLVAGPTGCGKSTTLHALVHQIDAASHNILTLEDPVEIPVAIWQQTSIDAEHALGYADAIRCALRQDPDVLLIGEIRDAESAAMTLRAALTGHRVYASVHAQDAVGALYRLLDLGIPRGDLAVCVDAIVAQRLLRRRCQGCQGTDADCRVCNGSGVAGRVAMMEILAFDDSLRAALRRGDAADSLHAAARRAGFIDMHAHARRLHADGIVGRDEIERHAATSVDRQPVSTRRVG